MTFSFNVLSTGSKGNAVIVNDYILIDCGVPYTVLEDYTKNLKLVLLTHIHGDHFKKSTIKKLAQNRPNLRFGCCDWLYQSLIDCGVKPHQIDRFSPDVTYNYKLFSLSPFILVHNVPNCGYRIFCNNKKLFYATDTNSLKGIEAKDYDLYMIEANYTDEDIKQRIKEKTERGEYCYEYDVLKNHLSKAKADDFIYSNIGPNGQYVYLHGHQK